MLSLHRYFDALRRAMARPVFLRWCCVALALLAVVSLCARERGGGGGGSGVSVDDIAFTEQDDWLVVRAKVTNGTDRRVYVYDQRALDHYYDEGSGTLTAVMHTVPLRPTGSSADCHVMLPNFRAIEPFESAEVRLKLPRHSKTYVHGAPARENPVASRVRLELGWSDEPLTLHDDEHALCTYAAGTRIQARERGIAIRTSR